MNASVVGTRNKAESQVETDASKSVQSALKGERPVFFDGNWITTSVYNRHDLPLKVEIECPAILEQKDTTILLEPDCICHVDTLGNLVIELK